MSVATRIVPFPAPSRFVHRIDHSSFDLFARWYDRWVQRQHLAELDDRMLRDIGISRAEAGRESRKLF
ncbi:MAG: DUF1127 domain-containing protein [Rhizobiaceae bacterium]|nr:DUF1127 domain-containing protein [Rhizobiaceae bacterium]